MLCPRNRLSPGVTPGAFQPRPANWLSPRYTGKKPPLRRQGKGEGIALNPAPVCAGVSESFPGKDADADDLVLVWDSRSEFQGLWGGAKQLSTRRAVGVDPKGGHQVVSRGEGAGRRSQCASGAVRRLSMGNPSPSADRHQDWILEI